MTHYKKLKSNINRSGFTIIELLITIIIIAVLSAIVILSFRGITNRATEAALASDLSNAKQQPSLYFAENNSYPTAFDDNGCPSAPKADTGYCLKFSNGNEFKYYGTTKSFTLTASKGAAASTIDDNSSPAALSLSPPADCPSGFIPVPGDLVYGTSGFCVMKYEAKQVGTTTVPTSTAAGMPWVNISQATATANAPNVAGCMGCHLITEAQWMTLAKNVLSVDGNWSGGAVGSGYIFSGHNDSSPANALVADVSDMNGYANTGNVSGEATVINGMAGNTQKRTLTLTNGEVIWDMSGNVWEWTSGQSVGNQPGVSGSGYNWREFTALTASGSLAVNPTPSGTGLVNANTWTTANGIGGIYSNTEETTLRGFIRGGSWGDGGYDGVLYLYLGDAPSNSGGHLGFRVSRD